MNKDDFFDITVKVVAHKGQHYFQLTWGKDYPLYDLEHDPDLSEHIKHIRKVPAKATGDGSSAPIRKQKAIIAAQAHDHAYKYIRSLKNRKLAAVLRAIADEYFYLDMIELDAQPRWRAFYSWVGLRLFGWLSCRYTPGENPTTIEF